MTLTAKWSLPVLILIHKAFIAFSLPCPAGEWSDRAAWVGTWHPAKANPHQGHALDFPASTSQTAEVSSQLLLQLYPPMACTKIIPVTAVNFNRGHNVLLWIPSRQNAACWRQLKITLAFLQTKFQGSFVSAHQLTILLLLDREQRLKINIFLFC